MGKDGHEIKAKPGSNNNKNSVRVNNNFSLTINFGDSLNILALIAGIYLIRGIAKKRKSEHKKM